MKRLLLLCAGALCAGALVLSLLPGPYGAAVRSSSPNAGFLESAQLDPASVAALRRACANCHSNQTEWPLYSRVFPVSWLIQKDVSEGRRFLNFSVWPDYGTEGQRQLLTLASGNLATRTMPPARYLALHHEARLSDQEIARLAAALEHESARLKNTPPGTHP